MEDITSKKFPTTGRGSRGMDTTEMASRKKVKGSIHWLLPVWKCQGSGVSRRDGAGGLHV